MKLIGNKDKGYQLVSSFAPKGTKSRGKKGETDPKNGNTDPEESTATDKRKDDE